MTKDILERIEEERVFSMRMNPDGTIRLREGCNDNFSISLDRGEITRLASRMMVFALECSMKMDQYEKFAHLRKYDNGELIVDNTISVESFEPIRIPMMKPVKVRAPDSLTTLDEPNIGMEEWRACGNVSFDDAGMTATVDYYSTELF